jgi:hypothetical protein
MDGHELFYAGPFIYLITTESQLALGVAEARARSLRLPKGTARSFPPIESKKFLYESKIRFTIPIPVGKFGLTSGGLIHPA